MNTQPPRRSDRTTWISPEGTTRRIEIITGRWSLSRYSPTTRVGRGPAPFGDRGAGHAQVFGDLAQAVPVRERLQDRLDA
jgi:hypothetical protein